MNQTPSLFSLFAVIACAFLLKTSIAAQTHDHLNNEGEEVAEAAESLVVTDPEEALRILEQTGRWMEQVAELENDPPGRQTEESHAIRLKVRRALGRIDLEKIEFQDGVLLSDEELIERAIAHVRGLFENPPQVDLKNPPPVVDSTGGIRVIRFRHPPDGPREYRFHVYIHPLTGHVYALLLE